MKGIPTKTVKENLNMFAIFLAKDINTCINKGKFPDKQKMADITRAFKKRDKNDKSNYRPVSVLPILSKVYGKCLYKQVESYMENILSNFQCGFKKGFNAQQCLSDMIEKCKGIMDKGGHFSALLADLSKAFDCPPHDFLIAKLDAYGFKSDALYLTFNYLSNRKERIKKSYPLAISKILLVEFHMVLCWVLCYLTFFSQIFFFFVLLQLQAMLMTMHHTQRGIVLKKLCKK